MRLIPTDRPLKSILIGLSVLLLLTLASPVHGNDPFSPSSSADCDRAILVKAGEPSPCDGLVISDDMAKEAIDLKLVVVPQLKEEIAFLERNATITQDELQAHIEIEKTRGEAYKKAFLEKLEAPPFYQTFEFGLVVGVLASVSIFFVVN